MFRSPYVDVDWVSTYHQLAPPFQQIIDIWESWRGLFVGLGSERVNDCSVVMLSKKRSIRIQERRDQIIVSKQTEQKALAYKENHNPSQLSVAQH